MLSRGLAGLRASCFVVLGLLPEIALAGQFGECDSAASAQPDSYESALCFYRKAASTGDWDAASTALSRQMRDHPEIAWYQLVFGYVQAHNGKKDASSTFAAAAARFLASDIPLGELLARANLRIRYFESGRLQEAGREYIRIQQIGESTDIVELKIRALVVQGRHLIDTKSDLNEANAVLARAQRLANQLSSLENVNSVPYFLRRSILNDLGQLNTTFGNYSKAIEHFTASAKLAKSNNDLGGAALAGANRANALLELHRVSSADVRFEQVVSAAELASQEAAAAQILALELFSNRVLAEVLAARDPAAAIRLTRSCITRAGAAELFWQKSQCQWVQAYAQATSDPELATDTIEQAVDSMRRVAAEVHAQTSFGWRYLMRIYWLTKPAERAYGVAQEALSAIEELRTSQTTTYARNSVFSAWTHDYKWLIGRLLAVAESTSDPTERTLFLQRALAIGERMRAQGLLELMYRSSTQPKDNAAQNLDRQIARLNQALMNASPMASKRLHSELVALEHREATSRGALSDAGDEFKLTKLQSQLANHEAALVLHIPHQGNALEIQQSKSWLIAITKETVSHYPIPSAQFLLRAQAAMRSGDNQSAEHFSELLYKRLLAKGLAAIPENIDHIILVPDAPLNSLPFTVLQDRASKSPLVQKNTLSIVPSLSTWLRLRSKYEATHPPRSLVIAAPDLSSYGKQNSSLQIWQGSESVSLRDLPAARVEAEAASDALPGSVTWIGQDSSEQALKNTNLAEFGIIHFAAHAVVDDQNPDRSALLLTPGNRTEDGLLQVREISNLQLDGQLVLLASCQSAIGRDLRGEGMMSISRAFIAAGANTVIGTLRPVRDDTTAALLKIFYQQLSQGANAASALRSAQLRMRKAGDEENNWSAFVLYGNGAWRTSPAL